MSACTPGRALLSVVCVALLVPSGTAEAGRGGSEEGRGQNPREQALNLRGADFSDPNGRVLVRARLTRTSITLATIHGGDNRSSYNWQPRSGRYCNRTLEEPGDWFEVLRPATGTASISSSRRFSLSRKATRHGDDPAREHVRIVGRRMGPRSAVLTLRWTFEYLATPSRRAARCVKRFSVKLTTARVREPKGDTQFRNFETRRIDGDEASGNYVEVRVSLQRRPEEARWLVSITASKYCTVPQLSPFPFSGGSHGAGGFVSIRGRRVDLPPTTNPGRGTVSLLAEYTPPSPGHAAGVVGSASVDVTFDEEPCTGSYNTRLGFSAIEGEVDE